MEKIEFSIYSKMVCGHYEQSIRTYKKLQGKSGNIWYISIIDKNIGDHIYVDTKNPNSNGFGGSTLSFQLDDGTIDRVKGPWHSGADSLFCDTGYDLRDKHLTQGIIAKSKEYTENYKNIVYSDILHYDENPVIGEFNRITKLAEKLSKEHKCTVFYAVKSNGGGNSGSKQYKEGD